MRAFLIVLLVALTAGASEVHRAIEKGDLAAVKKLVSAEKALLDAPHGYKVRTPLHHAIDKHEVEIVQYLVSAGAALDARDKDGKTPLHLATLNRFPPRRPKIPVPHVVGPGHRIKLAAYLISKGADVNAVDERDQSVLFDAVSNTTLPHMPALLLSKGANVNTTNRDSQTALYVAAYHGRMDQVKLLLKAKADVTIGHDQGRCPLSGAANAWKQGGGPEYAAVAKLLIGAGADVNAPTGVYGPVYRAAMDGNAEVLAVLLAHKAEVAVGEGMESPLHFAAKHKDAKVAQMLLAAGASPDAKSARTGETPLMVACQYDRPAVAALLVKAGAPLDTANRKEETALHIAADKMALEIPTLLINNGAKANLANKDDETPLHLLADSARRAKKDEASVPLNFAKLLIKAGADPAAKDEDGRTAADIATKHTLDELAKLLAP